MQPLRGWFNWRSSSISRSGDANPLDATILKGMAKFKPARPKAKSSAVPRGGLPCVILVFSGFALVLLFLYFVLKYANG